MNDICLVVDRVEYPSIQINFMYMRQSFMKISLKFHEIFLKVAWNSLKNYVKFSEKLSEILLKIV